MKKTQSLVGRVVMALTVATLLFQCKPQQDEQKQDARSAWKLPRAPKEIEEEIQRAFPGAMTMLDFSDSMLRYVETKYKVPASKMLLGASTCVDDIIYTKDFHAHPEIKGPFHLGGLAGLPFTGKSGLSAFAHHIPDSGAMILFIEPHIGINEEKGWGYVLRHEQHHPSTCCGALMGSLDNLMKGNISTSITEDDYQGGRIGVLALLHEKEVLDAESPIVALTKVTSDEAEKQIMRLVNDLNKSELAYIFVVTGVLINTDYQYTDYQYVSHFLVYSVREGKFVEELKFR